MFACLYFYAASGKKCEAWKMIIANILSIHIFHIFYLIYPYISSRRIFSHIIVLHIMTSNPSSINYRMKMRKVTKGTDCYLGIYFLSLLFSMLQHLFWEIIPGPYFVLRARKQNLHREHNQKDKKKKTVQIKDSKHDTNIHFISYQIIILIVPIRRTNKFQYKIFPDNMTREMFC